MFRAFKSVLIFKISFVNLPFSSYLARLQTQCEWAECFYRAVGPYPRGSEPLARACGARHLPCLIDTAKSPLRRGRLAPPVRSFSTGLELAGLRGGITSGWSGPGSLAHCQLAPLRFEHLDQVGTDVHIGPCAREAQPALMKSGSE